MSLSGRRDEERCCLRRILEQVADHPINRIEEISPWNLSILQAGLA